MNSFQDKKDINLTDVAFYFDGVASTRQDQGGLGRRTAEILALRQRLLSIPEHEFEAVIKMMHRYLDNTKAQTAEDKEREAQAKLQQANHLYSAVNESIVAESSVDPVDAVV